VPDVSIALIEQLGLARNAAIVDVGGGASTLAAQLLSRGFADITVLDISAHALELARAELGAAAKRLHWIEHDLLAWSPRRHYDLWHDRAVFHFLVESSRRELYAEALRSAVRVGGKAIIGTFAMDGPKTCSGLPVVRYGPHELTSQFGGGFTLVSTRREQHTTPGNRLQPYTWVTLEHVSG
jgi:SAM-dependent methyltransferase